MAHDLKGDLCEQVTDDTLFARSSTAGPRYGPARGGLVAPNRSSLPGQRLLRDAALANPPRHRRARTQAPWRRQPGRTHAAGPGAAPRADPTAARCHPPGVPPTARRLVQPHDDLARPEPAGAAAQEE